MLCFFIFSNIFVDVTLQQLKDPSLVTLVVRRNCVNVTRRQHSASRSTTPSLKIDTKTTRNHHAKQNEIQWCRLLKKIKDVLFWNIRRLNDHLTEHVVKRFSYIIKFPWLFVCPVNCSSSAVDDIINNYSPKWRWIVVDIYRAAKRWG